MACCSNGDSFHAWSPPEQQCGLLLNDLSTYGSAAVVNLLALRSSAGPCLGKPLASNAGWELLDSKTSPLLGRVDDSPVELGKSE